MHRPVRTCIGCRGRADKNELLRLVLEGTAITLDTQHIKPGRGAYLHRSEACLRLAVRRRAVGRALRTAASSTEVADVVERLLDPVIL